MSEDYNLEISNLIAAVRAELDKGEAQSREAKRAALFYPESLDIEIHFIVKRDYRGSGKFTLVVVDVNVGSDYAKEQIQKITLKMKSLAHVVFSQMAAVNKPTSSGTSPAVVLSDVEQKMSALAEALRGGGIPVQVPYKDWQEGKRELDQMIRKAREEFDHFSRERIQMIREAREEFDHFSRERIQNTTEQDRAGESEMTSYRSDFSTDTKT